MWNLFRRKQVASQPRRKNKQPALRFEDLEGRRMLAGDVTMVITGANDLVLTGDSANNEFVVERLFSGVLQVRGVSTNIVFNSVSAPSHQITGMVSPQGIDGDVDIDGGLGDDMISFIGLEVGGNLNAVLNGGDDTFHTQDSDFLGDLTVSGGSGSDDITLMISDVSGDTNVIGSSGDDVLYADSLFIGGSFTFEGGSGNDEATTYFVEEYGASGPVSVTINGGADDDTLTTQGTIADSLTIDGGNGNDTITDSESTLTGNLTIEGGEGLESVDVSDGYIDGDLWIHVRAGETGVTEPITISGMEVMGKTGARGSTGNQNVTISGSTLARVDVVLGGGDDTILISNNSTALMNIKGGSGADDIDILGNTLTDQLLIDAGGGIDNITTGADDMFDFVAVINGGLNHNDVANLGLGFKLGANVTSIENLTLTPPTTP